MAPLTQVVMVMREFTFHPSIWSMAISWSYLWCLCVRACSGNLSWQYVNSMSWSVMNGEGVMGREFWLGAPIMHRMSSLNLAWHWHGER